MPVTVHPPGIGLKDDRLAPPRPDFACRLRILEYVDVVPLAPDQTRFQDGRQEPLGLDALDQFVIGDRGSRSSRSAMAMNS